VERSLFAAPRAVHRIEHGPKRELHLRRVGLLGLLSEELPLEPFELEEHEAVELLELRALVLGLLALLLALIELLTELVVLLRERRVGRLHLGEARENGGVLFG